MQSSYLKHQICVIDKIRRSGVCLRIVIDNLASTVTMICSIDCSKEYALAFCQITLLADIYRTVCA